jgi:hypothetical protein
LHLAEPQGSLVSPWHKCLSCYITPYKFPRILIHLQQIHMLKYLFKTRRSPWNILCKYNFNWDNLENYFISINFGICSTYDIPLLQIYVNYQNNVHRCTLCAYYCLCVFVCTFRCP